MQNNTPKLVFVAFALFGLLSIALFYEGIGRLKATGTPPFGEGLYSVASFLRCPPTALLVRLASPRWRIAVWLLGLILPVTAGVLSFRSKGPVLGFAILLLWAAVTGVLGFWTWLFSAFHALKV
jgi:hypothetical protein